VRTWFTFDCAEWDVSTEELIRTHSNAGDNSGGEQEKLMAFCLAGALSFNLASPESADNRPVFAQPMLDEAFSKSDPQFAQQALQAFRKFGFQLVIIATVQNAATIQPSIDSVVMVSKTEPTGRNARPVASVATRTISEFTSLRQEMRASAGRAPATGVTGAQRVARSSRGDKSGIGAARPATGWQDWPRRSPPSSSSAVVQTCVTPLLRNTFHRERGK
jgi:hypothetical protein